MRVLVHLSDLHFGRVDTALLGPLAKTVEALSPDVLVVSGDLTQRARSREFEQAAAYLRKLPGRQVVVPGNHDVPLYNVFDRLLRPLAKFRRHVQADLSPSFIDDEIAVLGVNTARSLVVKNGRINEAQVRTLRETFRGLADTAVKVVVTHHPFDVSADRDADERVGRADMALRVFAECGVDVLLAGHLHVSRVAGTGRRDAPNGHQALVVSAGTATSTRGRGEANSFNVLRLRKERIEIDRYEWKDGDSQFTIASREAFEKSAGRWTDTALNGGSD